MAGLAGSAKRDKDRRSVVGRRLHNLLLGRDRAASPEGVVGRLTAMQAQEHRYALWSVAQRTVGPTSAAAVTRAFDEGRFLRTHVLRPTWHYVAATDMRWLLRVSGPRVEAGNVAHYRDLGLSALSLGRSNDVIAEAVSAGPRSRAEIAAALDRRRLSTSGERLTYMLMHAELTGVVCSGPMTGAQHTYAAFERRVPLGEGHEGDGDLAELAWRYFSTRGPATLRDFSWWSGLGASLAKKALASAAERLGSVDIDGVKYWSAPAEHGPVPPGEPLGAHLLQCYDELIVSYTQTREALRAPGTDFPLLGREKGFRHVVLVQGQLVGHWRDWRSAGGLRTEVRVAQPLTGRDESGVARAIERYVAFAGA